MACSVGSGVPEPTRECARAFPAPDAEREPGTRRLSRETMELNPMPTSSGHTKAILASRVKGTPVYNTDGERIGHVEDVMLDKLSNNIMFAVIGFGGFLGVGEKYHPVPWAVLNFDPDKGGYIIDMEKEELERAPSYELDELTANDAKVRGETFGFYHTEQYW
jgi:sporulation protein YlmC with PRC-barrel domain